MEQYPPTYSHFEMTPQHWGSNVVGYWKTPEELKVVPKPTFHLKPKPVS